MQDVPLCDRSKSLAQRVNGKRLRMVSQVPRDAVSARRQEAAPFDLEMPNRRLVATPRIVARGGLDVA
uniref:hypothetical protein n=1 Tax=Klebsiella pneumoniae TaxID=573 RepID=UPI001952CB3E